MVRSLFACPWSEKSRDAWMDPEKPYLFLAVDDKDAMFSLLTTVAVARDPFRPEFMLPGKATCELKHTTANKLTRSVPKEWGIIFQADQETLKQIRQEVFASVSAENELRKLLALTERQLETPVVKPVPLSFD